MVKEFLYICLVFGIFFGNVKPGRSSGSSSSSSLSRSSGRSSSRSSPSRSFATSSWFIPRSTFSSRSSGRSSSRSFSRSSPGHSGSISLSRVGGHSTYPKQTWGLSSSSRGRTSIGGNYGGTGGSNFKPNPFGTPQYTGWSNPKADLGTYTAAKGGKKFGYKTPGYGTNWGTNFAGGTGQYAMKRGFSKKALGLGIGAGFLGGSALGTAGIMATYSVYHRYHAFRQIMYTRHPGRYWDWGYYKDYYEKNVCLYGCPEKSHCEWGFCECDAGTSRLYGRCWPARAYPTHPSSVDLYHGCTESSSCLSVDMNRICHPMPGGGICKCRNDMKWNEEAEECQIFMDVDCSSITYETKPAEAILTAVERTKKEIRENFPGEISPLGQNESKNELGEVINLVRTESANESLSNSLLTKMDTNIATDDDLKEAFCRDIDSFSFEMQPADGEPILDERPSESCSVVPSSACAIAYDSHDCSGGWKLVIPQGEIRFRWFTSYWAYRNDMDTIGVRAGCTLTLFSGSSFDGTSARISSYQANDRWVVLGKSEDLQHMEEDVESLQCICKK